MHWGIYSFSHPHPERPRSFWSAIRIETSGQTWFSECEQSICFMFPANQICQIWQEVSKLQTSSVEPAQRSWFSVLSKSSAASGDKNVFFACSTFKGFYTNEKQLTLRLKQQWKQWEMACSGQDKKHPSSSFIYNSHETERKTKKEETT